MIKDNVLKLQKWKKIAGNLHITPNMKIAAEI